jgi:hypothetical protein
MTANPRRTCEELDRLRCEAKFAGLRAGQTGRYGQLGAAELKKEAQRMIDALIKNILSPVTTGSLVLPETGQS